MQLEQLRPLPRHLANQTKFVPNVSKRGLKVALIAPKKSA